MANEKRLIDANEVLQRNEEAFEKANRNPAEHFVGVVQYHTVKEMVNSSPTVDAVEVVHGRWDEVTDQDEIVGEMDFYKCSVCGKLRWFETNYCPNCGAKMDGDGNG